MGYVRGDTGAAIGGAAQRRLNLCGLSAADGGTAFHYLDGTAAFSSLVRASLERVGGQAEGDKTSPVEDGHTTGAVSRGGRIVLDTTGLTNPWAETRKNIPGRVTWFDGLSSDVCPACSASLFADVFWQVARIATAAAQDRIGILGPNITPRALIARG